MLRAGLSCSPQTQVGKEWSFFTQHLCVCVVKYEHLKKCDFLNLIVSALLFISSLHSTEWSPPTSQAFWGLTCQGTGGHTLTIRDSVLPRPPPKCPLTVTFGGQSVKVVLHLPRTSCLESSHHNCSEPGPPRPQRQTFCTHTATVVGLLVCAVCG